MNVSPAIGEAARWLVDTPHDKRGPVVVELRNRFGLNPIEAIEAISEANIIREGGNAQTRET